VSEQYEVVEQLPKLSASVVIDIPKLKQIIKYDYQGEVPKELMDAYERIVGNGLAKVTIGADMAVKDFGTGATGSCFVTLTCNQDEKTIDEAARLAGELARAYAQENRQRGETELQTIMAQRGQSTR
jgi:hypothetical protein